VGQFVKKEQCGIDLHVFNGEKNTVSLMLSLGSN